MSTERIQIAGEFLTRLEVADRLKVSVRTVDRYITDGKLASVKLPGDRLVRIPSEALASLMEGATAS